MKQQAFAHLTVGLDAYYKYAHDLLDEGQFGAPIILTPFNYKMGINKGVELTTDYNVGNFTFYGNLAIANQLAKGIKSAQFNFNPSDLLSADGGFVNTDHSQLKTASAGVAYLWRGTRFTADMIAGSGLRSQPDNDLEFNGETVPSYQQVNLGISHVFPVSFGGPVTVRLRSSTYWTRSICCAAKPESGNFPTNSDRGARSMSASRRSFEWPRSSGQRGGPARRAAIRPRPRDIRRADAALPAVQSVVRPGQPSAEAHP